MRPPEFEPYSVLGLTRGAPAEEVKRQYRLMAKAFHPDLHADSVWHQEQLKRINAAYEFLSDPDRKAAYDGSLSSSGASPSATPSPAPRPAQTPPDAPWKQTGRAEGPFAGRPEPFLRRDPPPFRAETRRRASWAVPPSPPRLQPSSVVPLAILACGLALYLFLVVSHLRDQAAARNAPPPAAPSTTPGVMRQ